MMTSLKWHPNLTNMYNDDDVSKGAGKGGTQLMNNDDISKRGHPIKHNTATCPIPLCVTNTNQPTLTTTVEQSTTHIATQVQTQSYYKGTHIVTVHLEVVVGM